jgi:hypothetical protein
MKKKNMKLKKTASGKYMRFCEICGSHAGLMSAQEWHTQGRMCKSCAEVYASSLEIEIDRVGGTWKTHGGSWELPAERQRISRFS